MVSYTYDANSRITGIAYSSAGKVIGDLSYEYNAIGQQTAMGGSLARVAMPQEVTQTSYDTANRLTQWNNSVLTYDNSGNMLSDGSNHFTWDSRGQLSSLNSSLLQYDAEGRRVLSPQGVSFLYDRGNAVAEFSGTTLVASRMTGGIDEFFSRTDAGGTWIPLVDGLGSILFLTDNTAALKDQYVFEPFGATTSTGNASSNRFEYTGRENEGNGIYYYRARYLNATFGRFLSEDPLRFAVSPNFYAYVFDDPTGQIDPSGMQQKPGNPAYNPGAWNGDHQHTNNCYSYACDINHPPGPWDKPQPGDAAGMPRHNFLNCIDVKNSARADGLKNGSGGECPCKYYKVRLYFTSNFGGSGSPDYHWYRQDSNGQWSSKHGWEPVGPQLPNTGAVDRDASSWGYDIFCGTMCVKKH